MAGQNKSTFDPQKTLDNINRKAHTALNRALADAVADIQLRLDSGKGTDGKTYNYAKKPDGSPSYYMKSHNKIDPVNWSDTGTLRRSIDFMVKFADNIFTGLIGVKDLKRGRSSNGQILRGLIEKFPKLWGLSNQEIKNLYVNFNRYFKS